MTRITGEAKTGCRQIHVPPGREEALHAYIATHSGALGSLFRGGTGPRPADRGGAATALTVTARGRMGGGSWRTTAHRGGRWRREQGDPDRLVPGQDGFPLMMAGRPQQDSNLRTRLRRGLLYTAATWQDVSFRPPLVAYRGRRRSGHDQGTDQGTLGCDNFSPRFQGGPRAARAADAAASPALPLGGPDSRSAGAKTQTCRAAATQRRSP